MIPTKNKKEQLQAAHVDLYIHKEADFRKYLLYLSHPLHIMWRNFLAGTFQGLGFVLGTAFFLALISFVLQQILGEIPFFSDFARALQLWLENNLQSPR